jgi:hypothetical protein
MTAAKLSKSDNPLLASHWSWGGIQDSWLALVSPPCKLLNRPRREPSSPVQIIHRGIFGLPCASVVFSGMDCIRLELCRLAKMTFWLLLFPPPDQGEVRWGLSSKR